jgi:hypothetical protein
MMDIEDVAIHPVVCQNFYFHRNSGFLKSQQVEFLHKDGSIEMVIFLFDVSRRCKKRSTSVEINISIKLSIL